MPTISNSTKSKNSQAKTDWITPPKYLDAMRKVFGKQIILDVASDTNANRIVRALHIYTKDDDGLSKPWLADNVYCNPPGSARSRQKCNA
jgi:cytochrome c peroxidase